MTQILRQSTAVDVLIGPFVDATDGYTAETGVSPAVKLSKNGQTLAAKTDVTTPVHDADGYYNCEFDATDTNTVGTMVLSVVGSAVSLPVRHEYQVVEEAVYDAMYAASAAGPLQSTEAGRTLDVATGGEAGIDWGNIANQTTTNDFSNTTVETIGSAVTIGDGGITAAKFGAGAITAGVIAADAIGASELAADAVAEIADAVWDENIVSAHGTADTAGLILSQLTHRALATNWATDVTANSALDYMADDGTAVYDRTTDSLQAIADSGGGGPTSAQIADAVWDELLAGHTTSDSAGELLNDWQNGGRLDLILDSRMAEASINTTGGAVDVVTLVTTTTTNTDMRGTDSAALATGVVLADSASHGGSSTVITLDHVVALSTTDHAISAITSGAGKDALHLEANGTGVARGIYAYGELTGIVGANASGSTGYGASFTSNGSGAGFDAFSSTGVAFQLGTTSGSLLDAPTKTEITTDVLTSQMTESYAANGVAPTLAQAQFAVHQMLQQFGISGTALTVRRLDNSTTAFIVTLDDATTPTDASRV